MKVFKCVAISNNRNSFGLRGVVFVALDGEAWQVGVHDLDCPVVGRSYGVLERQGNFAHGFSVLGWEIPRRLPKAPQTVVEVAFTEV